MIGKNGAKVLSCADMIKSLLDWECQNSLALAQWEICPGNAKWKTRKPLVPAACCLCSISEIGSHNGCQWLLALAGGRLTNIHAFPGSAGKSLSINECCTPSLPVYLSHSSIMSLESLHVHLRNACLLRHDEVLLFLWLLILKGLDQYLPHYTDMSCPPEVHHRSQYGVQTCIGPRLSHCDHLGG